MPMWQAPSTNNERSPDDIGAGRVASARPYLDVDGVVRWWSGADSLPAGSTELHMTIRASDGVRILSTTDENERVPLVFGDHILIR